MKNLTFAAAVAVAGAFALAATGHAQSFTWEGRMTPGSTFMLRNINGPVSVQRASGDRVEVSANKRATRGDPASVRIEAKRFGAADANVVVCAIWQQNATCDESGYHSSGNNRNSENDVEVEFTVRLPAGVIANVNTVNGDVEITGSSAAVQARTVNGEVTVETSGASVEAATVNGDIVASVTSAQGSGTLSFTTVSGSITTTLPSSINADLTASTVNGSIDSEFPVTVQGRLINRRVSATIGSGGRRLSLTTVNGSIRIRRG